MNVKNNKRRRESIEKITKVFIELIQTHGCDKSPEEIAQIISSEYQGRN